MKAENPETEGGWAVPREGGSWGVVCGDENVLLLTVGNGYPTVYTD